MNSNKSAKRNSSWQGNISPVSSSQKDFKNVEVGADFGFAKSVTTGSLCAPRPGMFFKEIEQQEALDKKEPSFPYKNKSLPLSFGNCVFQNIATLVANGMFSKKTPEAKSGFGNGNGAAHCDSGPLGKFSFLSSTLPNESILPLSFKDIDLDTEDEAIFDNLAVYGDETTAADTEDEEEGYDIVKAEWQEHYQKKAWQKKCLKAYSAEISSLRHTISRTPDLIANCNEIINRHRRSIRKLKGEQHYLPDTMPDSIRTLYDSLNSEHRRIREFENACISAKKRLAKVYMYKDALYHTMFSCRDFVIPHEVKKNVKTPRGGMIQKTWKTPSPGVPEVRLHNTKCPETGKFIYQAKMKWLKYCGSPFCLACSNKKNAARRKGLEQVMGWGLTASFISLTVPHDRTDDPQELTAKLVAADEKFRSGRQYALFCVRVRLLGVIRVFDWTWGPGSGHHPHIHYLFVFDNYCEAPGVKNPPFDYTKEEKWLSERWTKCCKAAGLLQTIKEEKAHKKYGFHCRTGQNAVVASYLTKFAPFEMASPKTKDGKNPSRFSPYQLFQLAAAEKQPGRYSDAYLDYMISMKHRRVFSASKSMKELMVLELPKKDEGVYLFHFDPEERKHNLEGINIPGITYAENHSKILEVAAAEGEEYLIDFPHEDFRPPPEPFFQSSIGLSEYIGAKINFSQIAIKTVLLYDEEKKCIGKTYQKIEEAQIKAA